MAKGDWWLKLNITEWLNDPKLRRLRRENRDSWLTACLMMTLDGDYQLKGTASEIANLLHLTSEELNAFIDDLKRTNVADVTLRNDCVTLVSRRYKKEAKSKELTRLRVARKRGNADVTPVKRDIVNSKSKKKEKEEELRGASASPSPPAKPVDLRKAHPAINSIWQVAGIYPPKDIWDDLIDQLGTDIDQVKLKQCFTKWRARGFNKANYDWAVDWYLNGIPQIGKGALINGTRATNQPRVSEREKSAQRGRNIRDIADEIEREARAELEQERINGRSPTPVLLGSAQDHR